MSESCGKVECSTHGDAYAAYVCTHLIDATGIDWYSGMPIDSDPWPNAWCGKCNEAFAAEGEWNEVSEQAANLQVTLLCHFCYEAIKGRYIAHEV